MSQLANELANVRCLRVCICSFGGSVLRQCMLSDSRKSAMVMFYNVRKLMEETLHSGEVA